MLRILTSAVTALAVAGAAAYAQQSTAAAVYESVAPAVVLVETDDGYGSGLLLNSNVILTVAHVLYPHHRARIVFPDGTELLEVPLIGWDLLADVAVLGPVQLDSPPDAPTFDTAGGLPVGADLFAIGYAGTVEPFPQPVISRGILSRYRQWADQATFLQTDAVVDDGQSGGVLLSAAGAVVGMTSFRDGRFGLVLSAADLLPRMTALLTGVDVPRRRTRYLAAEVQDRSEV